MKRIEIPKKAPREIDRYIEAKKKVDNGTSSGARLEYQQSRQTPPLTQSMLTRFLYVERPEELAKLESKSRQIRVLIHISEEWHDDPEKREEIKEVRRMLRYLLLELGIDPEKQIVEVHVYDPISAAPIMKQHLLELPTPTTYLALMTKAPKKLSPDFEAALENALAATVAAGEYAIEQINEKGQTVITFDEFQNASDFAYAFAITPI